MTKFLRLGDRVLGQSRARQIFAHRIGDLRRIHKIPARNVQVSVIFQHTGVDHLRHLHAVKLVKVRAALKRAGDLDRTVAAEIEEDHAVAFVDGADRLAVLRDDKRREILVDCVGFLTIGDNGVVGIVKLSALADDVRLPAELDHLPVCLVAVHGDLHSAAAGRDLRVARAVRVQLREEGFKRVDVLKRGGFSHVASVEQDVDADSRHALLLCLGEHCLQVIDVAVYVAVGEQTEEVELAAVLRVGDQRFPCFGREHLAAFDRRGDELGALCEHLTAAQRVVADLGVAHIVIRRQTDRGAVRTERDHRVMRHQSVEIRGAREIYSIGFAGGCQTYAVHNDGYDRADIFCTRMLLQLFHKRYSSI